MIRRYNSPISTLLSFAAGKLLLSRLVSVSVIVQFFITLHTLVAGNTSRPAYGQGLD